MNPELLSMIISLLAGAGFSDVSGGLNKISQSGQDLSQLMQTVPNLPIVMAGAGLKNAANSMEVLGPLLKQFQPPPQPEQEDPQKIQAALSMLSAPLGAGLSGVRPPATGPAGFNPSPAGPPQLQGPQGPPQLPQF